nr:EG 14 [Echinococcus granulosus]
MLDSVHRKTSRASMSR